MYLTVRLSQFPKNYQAALEIYVWQPRGVLPAVRQLGTAAVKLGMETLELARIHEVSLAPLLEPLRRKKKIRRAEIFFNEVNSWIEETHRAARERGALLTRMRETLDARTAELGATNRELKRGITRRKVMEVALVQKDDHYKTCLEESLQLQARLRKLTHQVIATQEDERTHISRELHNEIAQTLLGINVRLLSLKQESRKHSQALKTEIASAQRLVAHSVRSVHRVAREINHS